METFYFLTIAITLGFGAVAIRLFTLHDETPVSKIVKESIFSLVICVFGAFTLIKKQELLFSNTLLLIASLVMTALILIIFFKALNLLRVEMAFWVYKNTIELPSSNLAAQSLINSGIDIENKEVCVIDIDGIYHWLFDKTTAISFSGYIYGELPQDYEEIAVGEQISVGVVKYNIKTESGIIFLEEV